MRRTSLTGVLFYIIKRTYVPINGEASNMVKFIHAADLHLDSPFKGLSDIPEKLLSEIQNSTFQSLENIVQLAIQRKVDFVLLVGDIFDIEDRSVKAQVRFNEEMKKLNEQAIPVFIIHGNHDYVADKSAYLDLPENVEVFGTEVETKDLLTKDRKKIKISGFSYKDRHIWKRMIQDYPSRSRESDFHIALLHGSQEGISSVHGEYAPFSVQELQKLQYDYYALGHIHKRQQVHPSIPAYYAGNTQGRHRNESGSKGCYVVQEREGALHPEYVETAPIRWENVQLNLKDELSLTDILQKIQTELEKLTPGNHLVYLNLQLSKELSENIITKLTVDELNAAFSSTEKDKYLWITKIRIEYGKENNEVLSLKRLFPKAWETSMDELLSEGSFEEYYQELYGQVPSEFLDEMYSKEYKKDIIQEAEEVLNYLLDT